MKYKKKRRVYVNRDAGNVPAANAFFNNSVDASAVSAADGGTGLAETIDEGQIVTLADAIHLVNRTNFED